jgi:hypothetical protein
MSFWPIRAEIRPAFDGGLMRAQYLIGGVHIVLNKTQRNNINLLTRRLDATTTTVVFVTEDSKLYRLVNNPPTNTTTDADWALVTFGDTSSFRPVGEWDADNDEVVLTDAAANGRNGEFYFVTNSPTQRTVQYPGLFQGQAVTVVDGNLIVSVGDRWIVVASSLTWDSIQKPQVIVDYVNGNVIAHTHVAADITDLQPLLDAKYDINDTADHTIPFDSVPDAAIVEVEFLRQHYYTIPQINDVINEIAGGLTTFTVLTDTPSSYTGQAGKLVRVNSLEDGLEFVEPFSFSNGVYETDGVVRLGGSLNTPTTITSSGSTNILLIEATGGFAGRTSYAEFFPGSLHFESYLGENTNSSITISPESTGIRAITASGSTQLNVVNTRILINSNVSGFQGLSYFGNYHSNFVARSIPDVEWVQNYVNTSENFWKTFGTTTLTSDVTIYNGNNALILGDENLNNAYIYVDGTNGPGMGFGNSQIVFNNSGLSIVLNDNQGTANQSIRKKANNIGWEFFTPVNSSEVWKTTGTTNVTNPTISGDVTFSGGLLSGTFSSSGLSIRNPANTFSYNIVGGAITSDINLSLPPAVVNSTIAVSANTVSTRVPFWGSNGVLNNSSNLTYNNGASTLSLFRLSSAETFAQSSGSTGYTGWSLTPTFNTTGSYSGTGIGIDYNPTLTSTTGLTHLAARFTSGSVLVGASTPTASTQFEVRGTSGITNVMRVASSTNTAHLTIVDNGGITLTTGGGSLTTINGNTQMSGLVGINTSPSNSHRFVVSTSDQAQNGLSVIRGRGADATGSILRLNATASNYGSTGGANFLRADKGSTDYFVLDNLGGITMHPDGTTQDNALNSVLVHNRTTGKVFWRDASTIGSGGSPAGSNTQIQYNDSGAFGASSNLTYDGFYFKVGLVELSIGGIIELKGNAINRLWSIGTGFASLHIIAGNEIVLHGPTAVTLGDPNVAATDKVLRIDSSDSTNNLIIERKINGFHTPVAIFRTSTQYDSISELVIGSAPGVSAVDGGGLVFEGSGDFYNYIIPNTADSALYIGAVENLGPTSRASWSHIRFGIKDPINSVINPITFATEVNGVNSRSNILLDNGAIVMKNTTLPQAAAEVDGVVIHAQDSSDNTSSLALYLEQAVEAIGTFTPSHKLKIKINGTWYWIQLDQV